MIKSSKYEIVKDPENPEPDKIIAASIVRLSESMSILAHGPLKMSAIVILLQAETKLSRYEINKVLNALIDLERIYLKPKGK